jgi:hypothetical protein
MMARRYAMTVVEAVKQKMEALSPEKQQQVLDYIEKIEPSARSTVRQGPLSPEEFKEFREALNGIFGMCADRTDLPQDSAMSIALSLRRHCA